MSLKNKIKFGFIFLLIQLFLICDAQSQTAKDIGSIPDSIKRNANAIIRNYSEEIIFEGKENIKIKILKEVTVLNEFGKAEGELLFFLSPGSSLKVNKAELYDENGRRKRKVFTDNISSFYIPNDSKSISEGNDVYYVELNEATYPYTTIIEYEINLQGTLNIPRWKPVNTINVSAETCMLTVVSETNSDYRNKTINCNISAIEELKRKKLFRSWTITGIPAVNNKELLMLTPEIRLAFNEFQIQGLNGSMNTWKDFGNWYYNLNEDVYELPSELKRIVRDIASKYSNKIDKIKSLYTYLQKDYRYVSIQLGIGGYKSQTADFTYSKGYGDCKALSSLMVAMLSEAGIKAYPCLVASGKNPPLIFDEFAENRFNHVIVMVEGDDSPIWIECTSTSLMAGDLGDFTSNRLALLVEKDKSRLVKTPLNFETFPSPSNK